MTQNFCYYQFSQWPSFEWMYHLNWRASLFKVSNVWRLSQWKLLRGELQKALIKFYIQNCRQWMDQFQGSRVEAQKSKISEEQATCIMSTTTTTLDNGSDDDDENSIVCSLTHSSCPSFTLCVCLWELEQVVQLQKEDYPRNGSCNHCLCIWNKDLEERMNTTFNSLILFTSISSTLCTISFVHAFQSEAGRRIEWKGWVDIEFERGDERRGTIELRISWKDRIQFQSLTFSISFP